MADIIMKNWGPYHTYLLETYETLEELRRNEHDPYKQLALDEQKKIIDKVEGLYRGYLGTIGTDHGTRFLRMLEAEQQNLNTRLKLNKIDYMFEALGAASKSLSTVKNRFVGFRLEQ